MITLALHDYTKMPPTPLEKTNPFSVLSISLLLFYAVFGLIYMKRHTP